MAQERKSESLRTFNIMFPRVQNNIRITDSS